MPEESEVQVLLELGLTLRQTRVFLDLLKYDALSAREVATISKLPRQDAYTVLDELKSLGLVEKLLNVPAEFAAVPMEDALVFLLDRKVKQTTDLKTKTRNLIDGLKGKSLRECRGVESNLFLISEGKPYILRIKRAIEGAQQSIDVVSSNNLPQGIFSVREELQKATTRGVRIRCLTNKFENGDSKFFRGLLEYPGFEIRKIQDYTWARFCLYDKAELSVALSLTKDFAKSCLLWSNCPNIVEAYQDHFELMWSNATPDNQWKERSNSTTELTSDLPRPLGKKDNRRYVESLVS